MAVTEIPLVVPAYGSGERGVGGQRLINMMPLTSQGASKVPKFLGHTPALSLAITQEQSRASRGMYRASNGRLFHVVGGSFYEILENNTRIYRNALGSVVGPVQMCDNGADLLLVNGMQGILFNFEANTVREITDEHFPQNATHCAYTRGYFVANEPGTFYFRRSDLLDGDSWDLEQTGADGSPDSATCLCVCNLDVWVGGPQSIQVFGVTNDIDQIFQPITNAVLDVGVSARYSMVAVRGRVVFLSDARVIYASSGLQLERISTPGLEAEIAATDYTRATAWTLEHEGHAFYILTIDAAERTFVYDMDEKEWHERSHLVPETGVQKRWRGQYGATAFGRTFVGDSNGDAVYNLSRAVYADSKPDGTGTYSIRRQADSPDIFSGRDWMAMNSLELECVTGQGVLQGQGYDPQIMFSYSEDCGLSWSNERWASIGKQSMRGTRAQIRMVGRFLQRRIRVSATDPVPHTWQRLWAELESLS